MREGRVAGVLDFGFLTTVGDPHFDELITASVFDMYGPNARRSEDLLSEAFADRLGRDRDHEPLPPPRTPSSHTATSASMAPTATSCGAPKCLVVQT